MNNQETIFPKGDKSSADYFTGPVWVKRLVQDDDTFHCAISNVTFGPRARNNWHKHPGGQILIVINGVGYYQEKGKAIQQLKKGDVVQIPPNVEHWHGASPDIELIHIAINPNTEKGMVEWLQKVTEEEYNSFRS